MQKANHILQAIRKMGEQRIPLTRVYRCMYSEDLFLAAYAKIYKNEGALTPGTENDTVDGMSLDRIRKIIEQLRHERFYFRPVRRSERDKKGGGKRPLGLPNFSEKLVQEVLRMILDAYYEPRFWNTSHGFRPGRGCHTALTHIKEQFKGTTWFIEGDIKGCFDNIDHDILMAILARDIHDGRLLELIRRCLKAGVMEDWIYRPSYHGVPQGGILSPVLSNIFLHELDSYIGRELIPQHTRGRQRAANPDYRKLEWPIQQARMQGDTERARQLELQRRQLPSVDTQDPEYRRLRYVRYADDFILGFIGPKSEAEAIKTAIGKFLREVLHLEMSPTKTLITHARTEKARFLGYHLSTYHVGDKLTRRTGTKAKTRSINAVIRLGIPYGLIDELGKRYYRNGKVVSQSVLLEYSDAHIIDEFQQRFRGVAEYYKYAVDRYKLGKLKYVMQIALVKTLAHKFKISASQVYRKYRGTLDVDGYEYKTLEVEVPTKRGVRRIYWGAIPLKTVKPGAEPIQDTRYREQWTDKRSDLIQRLLADTCELCHSDLKCEVHHVRKLADLKKRWAGREHKPEWVIRMIALQRKSLVVCQACHDDIHAGRATPKSRE